MDKAYLEMVKLGSILGIGLVLLVIGFIKVKKRKDAHFDSMNDYTGGVSTNSNFSPNLNQSEQVAKNYINQYKSTYPRESLKAALIKSGNIEQDVEIWLNKYL